MSIITERSGHKDLVGGANADALHSHSGGGGGLDALPGAFRDANSTNITTTPATVGLDTEILDPDTNYTLSAGEITVAAAGYYQVSYNAPVNDDGSAGASRGRVFAWCELDTVLIAQSRAQDYHRETSGGSGISASFVVLVGAGDVLRWRIQVSSTVDVSTEVGEAALSLFRVRTT